MRKIKQNKCIFVYLYHSGFAYRKAFLFPRKKQVLHTILIQYFFLKYKFFNSMVEQTTEAMKTSHLPLLQTERAFSFFS